VHVFKETPPISTYIYGIQAGQFVHFTREETEDCKVPMRIFVRESKKDLIDTKEVFRIVVASMAFYENLFGVAFPFEKYDMTFCPEFRIRGMENVGAITFKDAFLLPEDE